MTAEPATPDQQEHPLHSRLVWSGVAAAIVGMVLIGLGMVLDVPGVAWGGAALTVAALLVAWRAGILYDVHSSGSLAHERKALAAGGTALGRAPTDREHDESAERHAEVVSEESRVVVGRSQQAPMPPLAPAATIVLLILGVWAYIGQWVLHYSFNVRGQDTALRDTGFAVVIVLTALYLRFVGQSRVASALGLLWGALLVVAGLVTAHAAHQSAVNEVVTGCLVIVCAACTWRR